MRLSFYGQTLQLVRYVQKEEKGNLRNRGGGKGII